MSLAKLLVLSAAAFALLLFGLQPGRSGSVMLPTCEEDCQAVLESWIAAEQARWIPILDAPAERFEADQAERRCDAGRTAQPVVHAVVLAPFYDNYVKLPGTQNDAALWRDLFLKRGVAPANLHILAGNMVTREAILDVMRLVVPCVRERDQVIVTYSGGMFSYGQLGGLSLRPLPDWKCEDASIRPDEYEKVCLENNRPAVLEGYKELLNKFREPVLVSSDVVIELRDGRPVDGGLVIGVRAKELSNFAIQIRNRNADVIFILDTSYAEDVRLLDRQERAGFGAAWRWQRGEDSGSTPDPDGLELFGSGEMAALYAARSVDNAGETKKTGGVVLGELTFAVSEALRSNPSLTIEQLAREVDRTMAAESSRQVPVFEASNENLRFLATRDEPEAHPERIDLINPRLTRGAIAIKAPELEIIARYDGPGTGAFAAIDGLNVEIDANGQFRRSVKLASRTEVPIRVYGRDASLLAERRLLFGEDEVEASLAPVGRRLALIIANQNYNDPAFPTLVTPIADGRAIQKVFAEKFGFTTNLKIAPGKERDLFLTDATKAEIQKALYDLRKSLTAEDQLVVFYAGHGQTDSGKYRLLGARRRRRERGLYLDSRAFEITEDIRKLASGAVLLISDSCYAGGLSRDSIVAPEGPRDRYLAKATRYKARQLIASGGDEPVQDGGGGSHSLFARALLEGLEGMPEKVFTANELFNNKVKPKAIEYAFATTAKGQTPVFYRMTHAGDEPESEFVFAQKQ